MHHIAARNRRSPTAESAAAAVHGDDHQLSSSCFEMTYVRYVRVRHYIVRECIVCVSMDRYVNRFNYNV